MRHKITISLVRDNGKIVCLTTFPLVFDGLDEPELEELEDEQLTELVLGRVLEYVTHVLL